MEFPEELKYTPTHEWARREGNRVRVGITCYAQQEISDVVYVELPKPGREAVKGKGLTVVESVKAAFDIYAPVSGPVTAVNQALESEPALVNRDPYGDGWLLEIDLKDPSEWDSLLGASEYQSQCITTH
ncbi:MAG: glycine cleavage system protein GcvH [Candidatus Omnitrophica bacterium]|nr:glycine cleavage system protein GcvH [Candidatus Omnitrophota bacterium]